MVISFIISFLFLLFLITFIEINKEKTNFIIRFILGLGILYFIYIFIPLILTIINLKSSTVILYINYKKNRKIRLQKFKFNRLELLYIIIIFGVCLIIGIIRFNGFKDIVYETTDPAVHYRMASIYSENLKLLNENNSKDELYTSFSHSMTGYYVNSGLFLKTTSGIIDSYVAFEIFDIYILFLLASTFYVSLLVIKEKRKVNIIDLIITLLYFGGYCLNDILFGFGYLGIGILAVNLILNIWLLLKNNQENKTLLFSLLALFNTGLFYSYYLFVPVIYMAEGLYIVSKWLKHQYSFGTLIKVGIYILIIPFIIGFSYFMLPGILSSGETILSTGGLGNEGHIYRNLWSNYSLFLPLIIYSLFIEIKNKEQNIMKYFLLTEIIFIIITLVLGLTSNKISSYYFYKSYFILWLFAFAYIVKGLNINNSKLFYNISIIYITVVVLLSGLRIGEFISNKNILFNIDNDSEYIVNIYMYNGYKILYSNPILTSEERNIIDNSKKYYDKCLNSDNEMPVIGNYLQKLWYYSLTDIVPIYKHKINDLDKFYEEKFDYNTFIEDINSQCLIVFNSSNNKDNENYIEINYDNYDILYENKKGTIIKKK